MEKATRTHIVILLALVASVFASAVAISVREANLDAAETRAVAAVSAPAASSETASAPERDRPAAPRARHAGPIPAIQPSSDTAFSGVGNFIADYVHEKSDELSAPAGSSRWWKGLLGVVTLLLYLLAVPRWGYGGVLRRIKEGEPTDTRAYVIFAASSVGSVANSIVDRSVVPALCLALLASYAMYTAALNYRLRRRIERERREARDESGMDWSLEERAFEALANTPCALWTRNGKVRRWSKGMEEALGYSEQEMRAMQDPIKTLYGHDRDEERRTREQLEDLFRGKGQLAYQKSFSPRNKDGKIVPLEFHTFLVKNKSGVPKGRISFVLPKSAQAQR